MHRCSQVAGSLLAFLLFLALELIRLPSQSLVHSLLFFIGYFCICLSTGRKCDLNFLVWHWLDTWVQIPRLFITSVCENLFGSLQHILFIFCVLEQKEIKKKKLFAQPQSEVLSSTVKDRGAVVLFQFLY